MSGSGFKGSGITDPFLTPDVPRIDSVTTDIGSANVTISAPYDIGGGAVTSYVVSAKQSDGTSVSATSASAGAVQVTITTGGTTTFAAQAFNVYGAGQFSGYSNSTTVYAGQELYGWGKNGVGEIGDNTNVDKSSPVQVGADITWSRIGAGVEHSLAIKSNGTLWAWGSRQYGEIGNGTRNASNGISSPVQIGALTDWTIVAGAGYASGAINSSGEIYCWGKNDQGAVGDNTSVDRSSPVQVGALTNWTQIYGGGNFYTRFYAFNTTGELWAWGANVEGALGDGLTLNRSSPVQIAGEWSVVDPGYQHTVGIKTNGTLWAWGNNDEGQLGLNLPPVEQSSPTQVGTDTNWASVAAGGNTCFAIKTDGTLWAWGENGNFALGNGTEIDVSSPIQIGALTNWEIISNSMAIKTDGTLWSWGRVSGDGTGANVSSPVQIGADTDWSAVDAGDQVEAGLGNQIRTALALLKVTS